VCIREGECAEDAARSLIGKHIRKETAKIDNPGSEDLFGKMAIETFQPSNTLHYHIELATQSTRWFRECNSFPESVLTPPQELYGSERTVTVWGRFRLDGRNLPEKNFVKILSDVSIPSADYQLAIRGVECNVTGDGPVFALRWEVDESAFETELGLSSTFVIDDDLLLNATGLLEDSLNQIVYAQREKKVGVPNEID
jgi:hypothetical protein